jgi:NTE family protein
MPVLFLVFCTIALFFASAFAQYKTVTLYMSGDYSSVEYHLGVLSEIERLQISIDTVVGTDWGAFAGALWSAGLSSSQIRELAKSLDSLPRAKQPQKSALLKGTWLVKHNENGALFLEEADSKPYFGRLFFDLRYQEILLHSNIGSKISFREIDIVNSYPFPPLLSHEEAREERGIRIFSNPIALRDTSSVPEQFYQQTLWSKDSALIMLRPHSKPNPDSLFEAGVAAVRIQRPKLSAFHRPLPVPNPQPSISNLPVRFYYPVFDNTPAELHGHLKSFWNPGDTGIVAVRNFLENLQKDASYRDLEITIYPNSFLQIKTDNSPQLSFSLFAFGGTLFGANIAANANFRFVNQFGYNLDLTAFYGQGLKGLEAELRFERFFMGDGHIYAKPKFLESEPTAFFQKSITEESRLINEINRSITLGFEKPTGNESILQIAAELEHKEIISGAAKRPIFYGYDDDGEEIIAGFIYEPVAVNSMFPYLKWLWQSEGYNRWFAREGFMAEFLSGLKAVSIIDFNQNTAPYVSSQGKISVTQPIFKYVSINGGAEFGANFRISKGKLALPEELYGFNGHDTALDNRYKFAMGMGSYMEEWQTTINSSHRYGILSTGFSLQWQGSGIFFTGGYGTEKFFAEPKIRVKTKIFDAVLGQSMVFSAKNRIFLSIQSRNF